MSYILTAITGGQNVGQAFTRVNENLAAIESNSGGNFVPLTGTSLGSEITGDIVITNSNSLRIQDGTDVNSTEVNISSIDFRDDYNSVKTTLQYTPLLNSDSVVNIIDTEVNGYMVIVPTPSGEGGKNIRVNSSGNAWEYVDLDAKFLALTGGTLTGGLSGTTFTLGEGSYFNTLSSNTLTANRIVNLPDASGTIALSNDLTGFVRNTGDTITGVYTINENNQNEAKINIIGTAPSINLSGDAALVSVSGIDVLAKTSIYPESIIFDDLNLTSLSIQPLLFGVSTGSSILNIIKPTGSTTGYFATVGDISTHPNEFIKVNNNGTDFTFGILSGSGTVAVTSSVAGYTIVGSGATRVQSAGTGTINIISSITNNTLVYRTISAGSQMNITESNGTIILAANPSEGVLFNSLGNQSVSNSTTETSVIFSSVQGTTTLKASTATTAPQQTAGRRYRFTANGTLQSHSSAGNLIARMKLGSVLLASSTTAMHNSIPASTTLFIDCTFTVRTAGASSNIQSRGIMHLTHTNFVSNGSNSAPIATATATAIDTRTDKVFDFTLQFGTANASNTFTISEATLEYLDI